MTNEERARALAHQLVTDQTKPALSWGEQVSLDLATVAIRQAFAAVEAETVERCAKVLDDELRLRPTYWGTTGGQRTPLHRLVDEMRALVKP